MIDLQNILKEHAEWLASDGKAGKRADLCGADLCGAELCDVDLRGAALCGAELCGAALCGAALCGANLRGADLCGVELRGADVRGTILDFSCWPLWCGSIGAIADDRLVAQLLFHVTRLDVSKCSGGVQEAMEHIRRMAVADLFCEYRTDVKPLDN